jgi:hypothetical protein
MTKLLPEKYKADVNHILIRYHSTPLFNAAVKGMSKSYVRYLLEPHNADIHLGNRGFANGLTVLHHASLNVAVNNAMANGLEDVVGVSLKHGGRSHWCRPREPAEKQ